MRKHPLIMVVIIWSLVVLPLYALESEKDSTQPKRPIDLNDIVAWRSIRSTIVSNDGQWFAYRVAPAEGDSEVVLRRTRDSKELRYPAGEASGAGGGGRGGRGGFARPTDIAFSEDSKWVFFTISPTEEEAKKLRQDRKPLQNKVGLVNLSSEEKTEYDKVKSAKFSGKNPQWIALHRYPGENQGSGDNRWTGSDLILKDLNTSTQLNIGNVSEFEFDKNGSWLAWIVDAQEKTGNGVQLRNMNSGVVVPLDSGEATYKRLTWTKSGHALAVLKGIEDKKYEDIPYSVLGFTGFASNAPQKVAYDPKTDNSFPASMTISPNRDPVWMKDLSAILFGIHELEEKKQEESSDDAPRARGAGRGGTGGRGGRGGGAQGNASADEEDLEKPDLVIWHWRDRRLQSMQQVQANRDKEFSYLSMYRVKENRFVRLADDTVREVNAEPEYRYAVGTDNSRYEWMGNLDGRRYEDLYTIDLVTGERKLAVEKSRWNYGPSPQGTHFLYYSGGHFFSFDMATGQAGNITEKVPTSFIDAEDDHNVVDPPIRPQGWTEDGKAVVLSDDWDLWRVPIDGSQATNLTVNGKKDQIRYQSVIRLDAEEEGINLARPVYVTSLDERTKNGGIARIENGKSEMLLWDAARFGRLMKAEAADTFLYTRETFVDYPNYHVTDASLKNGVMITDANPQQKDFLWSAGSRLINYTSAKGDKLQAALFLPADYVEGQSYPTIVYIYERLTQGFNTYYAPSSNGFNKSVYTSNGYAVLMPDIVYRVNDPGMSAVWCVVPAVKASIETGIVDAERVGIHGHSWGGYQTSFLITQTDVFSAAVAGAPLTNMLSMYSSIYWNTGGANQAIFESSQGRFTGGYWEVLDAYTRNSPVYFADNVQTPLIILHNDKDGAVDWNQGIEYYNTLRRLEKPVVMLQYEGENHGLRKPANQKDYTVRMKEFFNHYLKGEEAPPWLKEGVSHLDHPEHIEERTKAIQKEKAQEAPKKTTTNDGAN